MKLSLKAVVLSCSILSSVWIGSVSAHAETTLPGVKVQVNDSLISFPDAQPYVADDGKLMVPVRFVSDQIELKIDWSMIGDIVTVGIQNTQHHLQLRTGTSTITADGKTLLEAGDAVFDDGRVYVPLRVITDTFGIQIQWDNNNRIAILDADGKYHEPAWYTPPEEPVVETAVAQSMSSMMLQTAGNYTGVRYVWGGTTPSGFDCSGFVKYVFQQYGIWLPRTSLDMYKTAGSSVDDPQPGDLVFFARGGVTNHVGIYVGDGQFISATVHGIKTESLYSSYWGPKYIGAKRVM